MPQTALPSYIMNVLPGGKYHALAITLAKDSSAVLENKVPGGEWEDASHWTCPFNNNGEYRSKPKVQKVAFRVALMRYPNESTTFPYLVTSAESETTTENYIDFISWATEWTIVDVPSAD